MEAGAFFRLAHLESISEHTLRVSFAGTLNSAEQPPWMKGIPPKRDPTKTKWRWGYPSEVDMTPLQINKEPHKRVRQEETPVRMMAFCVPVSDMNGIRDMAGKIGHPRIGGCEHETLTQGNGPWNLGHISEIRRH